MSPASTVSNPPISVLLIDDCSTFRQSLKTWLDLCNVTKGQHYDVVGQAASVDQAIKLAAEQHPALILLDIELSNGDGVKFLSRYRHLQQTGKVLVLSGHEEDRWIFQAMQAGARGYLLKSDLSSQLCDAIHTVLQDKVYISPDIATSFFRQFHFQTGHSLKSLSAIHLTEREQEVLSCLVQGDSNEMISQRLHITVGTVKAYLRCIFEKMEVSSRTQAALKALKLGLVAA
ncbi:response regulator [Leptothoe spongobia]|uniref:Response regulator transcription factor n=1 Tax=Leptothoe spongobia TAU-MAC 1115 TaxID=1967444 RepID=A0A947DGI2_9CYAN|nr:response regulator transcription factor [Leptothoe spongobia]MBT9316657.1 response regulator transcription factor [Leptothoe spongobia TAU-MAC 1115]